VLRAATEPVEGLVEEPQLTRLTKGAAGRGANNNDFVWRESGVEECILAVPLLLGASHVEG
jgi:hypothetical protein